MSGTIGNFITIINPYYNYVYSVVANVLEPLGLQRDTIHNVVISLLVILLSIILYIIFGGKGDRVRNPSSTSTSSSSTSSSSSSGSRRAKRGNTIILTGLSGTGKTTLFLNLTKTKKALTTYTSINPNKGQYNNGKKSLSLVDMPGHEKMRMTLHQYLSNSYSLIYLIDGTQFVDNQTKVAQNLYDILVEPSISNNKIPILIFINKCDLDESIDESDIQPLLEREMDTLRKTRVASVSEVGSEEDDDSNREIYLGNEGQSFQFDQLSNPIIFAKGTISPKNNGKASTVEVPESIISFLDQY